MNNLKEQLKFLEELEANGKLYHSDGSDVIGEVEVIYHSKRDGKAIFTKTLHKNELLVTGAVFFTEKANNKRSNYRLQALDEELGIHTSAYMDEIVDSSVTPGITRWQAELKNELICGITIGNGGCGDTYNTVYKVNRAARKVPGMIPFRVGKIASGIPSTTDPFSVEGGVIGINGHEIDATTRDKYFMCQEKTEGNSRYVYLYGKHWDTDPVIYVLYEDGTIVPLNADTLVSDKFIRVFTKYSVVIDQYDIREWFKKNEGSTLKSLINSIGLVTGWPVTDKYNAHPEYCNVRQTTTFNMENHELKDSESTIEITYRLFIQ